MGSCPEAPPCTPVSPTGCRRRSPPWLHPPSRSRSLLLPRGNTPYGSVDPSWLPSPPSSRCGSPSRSTTSLAHPSSTGSASKRFSQYHYYYHCCLPHLLTTTISSWTSYHVLLLPTDDNRAEIWTCLGLMIGVGGFETSDSCHDCQTAHGLSSTTAGVALSWRVIGETLVLSFVITVLGDSGEKETGF